MKPITYLCFTLLSIIVQFCLMDFTNKELQADETFNQNQNFTKSSNEIFKTLKKKPHALYYRTEETVIKQSGKLQGIKYNNMSLLEIPPMTSTDLLSTTFDFLYDENVSLIDSSSTTEFFFIGLDNVTEVSLFNKKSSTVEPITIPKKLNTNKCYCNLLYNICDINCCCDNDCSAKEISLGNCIDHGKDKCSVDKGTLIYMCSQLTCDKQFKSNVFGSIFCIEKVNLPKDLKGKRNMFADIYNINTGSKWQESIIRHMKYPKFKKNIYISGKPIWALENGTVLCVEIPVTATNGYCNGIKALQFLTNEYIKCYVKIKDLHMFQVIKYFENTKIASPIDKTMNSTIMNCTTLHCANWTLFICKHETCIKYENQLHEPSCSENYCNNIAYKIEYEFYCTLSIIARANVKLYVSKVPTALQYVTQEIAVNFFMGNESIDNIIQLSGNPGYVRGLPVIVSFSDKNHTQNFYNNTVRSRNYLMLPFNNDGSCVNQNLTHNIVKFGYNKQLRCRISFAHVSNVNGTEQCLKIQIKIIEMFGLKNNVLISPYGNPKNLSDDMWLRVQKFNDSNIYGEYSTRNSKLLCYNLIIRVGFVIAFADMNANKEIKIVNARLDCTTKNLTLNIEELSTVITVDTYFIDVSKSLVNFVGSPHLPFSMPKDFFLPLPSNGCTSTRTLHLILYSCIVLCLKQIK